MYACYFVLLKRLFVKHNINGILTKWNVALETFTLPKLKFPNAKLLKNHNALRSEFAFQYIFSLKASVNRSNSKSRLQLYSCFQEYIFRSVEAWRKLFTYLLYFAFIGTFLIILFNYITSFFVLVINRMKEGPYSEVEHITLLNKINLDCVN